MRRKLLSVFLVILCILMSGVSSLALDNGTYTADTLTYYLNPDTGKTDDGGTSNAELGEGMCRSAVYKEALIEQSDSGVWVTMRMLLYSNLSNIKIYKQDTPGGSYSEVTYTVMKEDSTEDSADLRFAVIDPGCYMRTTMYVAPMGRDVCFYWKVDTSNAASGNSDFIVSSGGSNTDNSGATTGNSNKFTDISGHWAMADIEAVVAKGLFQGTSDTTFSPETSMTRGMFVTVLGRLSGADVSGYNSQQFSDVKQTQYYAPYIGWANDQGIVTGTSSTAFEPDEPVSCEQAAAIMVRYAEAKGVTLKTDGTEPALSTASTWAKESVTAAAKAGLITSQNTNSWNFTSAATRADVASIMMNYVNSYGN